MDCFKKVAISIHMEFRIFIKINEAPYILGLF